MPPRTEQELCSTVEQHVNLEEAQGRPFLGKQPPRSSAPASKPEKPAPAEHKPEKSKAPDKGRPGQFGWKERQEASRRAKPEVNLLFNKPLPLILEEIQHLDFFEKPKPMWGDSRNRPQNKYCSYHEDVGHTTENCATLRGYLNRMAKEGRIDRYVLKEKRGREEEATTSRENNQRPRNDRPPSVNYISGVVRRSQATSRQLRSQVCRVNIVERAMFSTPEDDPVSIRRFKQGVRPCIIYSDDDFAGVELPHNDALIVKA